jgi:hypothetical protein
MALAAILSLVFTAAGSWASAAQTVRAVGQDGTWRDDEEFYPEATAEEAVESGEPLRDPFAASAGMAPARAESGARRTGAGFGFRPGESVGGIPRMSLRGHVRSHDGETVALLEIQGGGVYIVREGDAVGLHDLGYDSVIRIREISRLHLVIESGSLGRVIVVR